MDINQSEVRRQVRDSQEANIDAMRGWRRLLGHLFDGRGRDTVNSSVKANLLGVPDRRQFFKIGGATVAGGALLAACSSSGSTATSTSTSSPPATTTAGGTAKTTDLQVLRTGTSLELLAVAVYAKALSLDVLSTPAIIDAAKMFSDQHQQHADLLKAATTKSGGKPYDKPNAYAMEHVVEPALPGLKTETDVVTFARQLENMAAATYSVAAGMLSTPELRAASMSIGGVEARHVAVYNTVLQSDKPLDWAPDPFQKTKDAASKESFVPAT